MFQLKMYGNFTVQEMALFTAEDRSWWIDRIKKYLDEQKKATNSNKLT